MRVHLDCDFMVVADRFLGWEERLPLISIIELFELSLIVVRLAFVSGFLPNP